MEDKAAGLGNELPGVITGVQGPLGTSIGNSCWGLSSKERMIGLTVAVRTESKVMDCLRRSWLACCLAFSVQV